MLQFLHSYPWERSFFKNPPVLVFVRVLLIPIPLIRQVKAVPLLRSVGGTFDRIVPHEYVARIKTGGLASKASVKLG
jgi:hypothetical protein